LSQRHLLRCWYCCGVGSASRGVLCSAVFTSLASSSCLLALTVGRCGDRMAKGGSGRVARGRGGGKGLEGSEVTEWRVADEAMGQLWVEMTVW
jgi:hypothetical protein